MPAAQASLGNYAKYFSPNVIFLTLIRVRPGQNAVANAIARTCYCGPFVIPFTLPWMAKFWARNVLALKIKTLLITPGGGRSFIKIRAIQSIRKQSSFETLRSLIQESAMRDVEFDLLLDAVRTAVAPCPEDDLLFLPSPSLQPTLPAANDNVTPWPLVPFPEGWYASC